MSLIPIACIDEIDYDKSYESALVHQCRHRGFLDQADSSESPCYEILFDECSIAPLTRQEVDDIAAGRHARNIEARQRSLARRRRDDQARRAYEAARAEERRQEAIRERKREIRLAQELQVWRARQAEISSSADGKWMDWKKQRANDMRKVYG